MCKYRVEEERHHDDIHVWWIVNNATNRLVAGPYNVPITLHEAPKDSGYQYEVRPEGANYADMLA
jgi:predicted secreted protein